MRALMRCFRHLRNPLPQQRRALLVYRRPSEFGHRDPRFGAFEAIDQETVVGVARRNREIHSAAAASGSRDSSATKPVGLVFIGVARRGGKPAIEQHVFPGDRAAIRAATVARALELLARG